MEDLYRSAQNIIHIMLNNSTKDEDAINNAINNVMLMPDYSSLDKGEMLEMILADLNINTKETTELVHDKVKPWLNDAKHTIKWDYWKRYKDYLLRKDASFPVDSIDEQTDKIIDKLVKPEKNISWDRRGLVVGHVQSGKTANFIGLINKAADIGYSLIIVIAGIHNTLRAQTQSRIDEGFIGRSSIDLINGNSGSKIGVGKIHDEGIIPIQSFTSADDEGDFNIDIATRLNISLDQTKHPVVLVIKKQKHVLENLISWLTRFANATPEGKLKISNIPMLMIDDEADNASVNTSKEIEEAKTINRHIRTLLNLFNQKSFIGYTATPFANLFIPDNWKNEHLNLVKEKEYEVGPDLFPKDFIINLPAPNNYMGAAQIFGYRDIEKDIDIEGLNIISYVTDQEPEFPLVINKNNKDDLPDTLPQSLKEAIKVFVLCSAARRVRGQGNKDHSMLIHIGRYVAWIDRVARLVNNELKEVLRNIKEGGILKELEVLFYEKIDATTQHILEQKGKYIDPKIKHLKWEDVKSELILAATKIEVKAVHGRTSTRGLEYTNVGNLNYHDYEKGYSVIAVGGDKMSRGVTLEGLMISYFLRTTKMYDSLMQMGRWFGYRPGYGDLCRLYTTTELMEWFRHVTIATEVMRDDFDMMSYQGKSPKDFRLKVLNSPTKLAITSAGKMKEFETLNISFSGSLLETYSLDRSIGSLENNLKQAEILLSKLKIDDAHKISNNFLWKNNFDTNIITEFLAGFISNQPNINGDILNQYIEKQEGLGTIEQWSIVLINNSSKNVVYRSLDSNKKIISKEAPINNYKIKVGSEPVELGLTVRNDISDTRYIGNLYQINKNSITGSKDRYIDLDQNGIGSSPKKDVIKERRKSEKKAVLIIYPLDPKSTETEFDKPIIGFALSFPEQDNDVKLEFSVRKSGSTDIDKGFEMEENYEV
ncbi:Z1 domain-containing protein [Flammeovirga yaeyamensis]|uniref:Z1 domain-containing protein n=1 Tax=Flammeovirga yaeyamensis TaxID=367791 RepID=A0AAX1MZ55_9BACT|nr:Z1 domain-containing protein [Flammeovirga yaeyamensis]MBB3695926.1 hypothetical protein [Flammeovirga yaeyamensis]NMF34614.1 Z1 domain-containing protein [Flammeovirga yaeyamensis]QWG00556.1 Z1 domain-containing protein [Flammeovirga yaeyamensis]